MYFCTLHPQDDFESVLYVLLDIATQSKLPWRFLPAVDIDAGKVLYMLKAFDSAVLSRCLPDFRPLVTRLRQAMVSTIGDVQQCFDLDGIRGALAAELKSSATGMDQRRTRLAVHRVRDDELRRYEASEHESDFGQSLQAVERMDELADEYGWSSLRWWL